MPSERTLKAIALKAANPLMTDKQAALEAGFSPSTAHNARKNIFNKPLVQTWLDNYKYQLNNYGIHPARLASKLSDLLDAEDQVMTMIGPLKDKEGNIITKPDRKTQVAAVKLLHEVFQVKPDKEKEGLKRRVTLEEFEEEFIQG